MNNLFRLGISTRKGPQICDECFKRRKKCDRGLPACDRCKSKNRECTRLRKHKIQRFIETDENETTPSPTNTNDKKYQSSKVVVKKESSPFSLEDKRVPVKFKFMTMNNIPKITLNILHPNYNSPVPKFNFFSTPLGSFPFRTYLVTFFTNDLESQLYKYSPKMSLYLFLEKFKTFNIKQEVVYEKDASLLLLSNQTILRTAILAYFKFFNPINPLFTLYDFINHKRPRMLIFSVYLVGLTLIRQSEDTICLSNILKQKIDKMLTLSIVNVNLHYIQTSIILAIGLRGQKIAFPSYLIFDILRHSHSIGLHLNIPITRLPKYLMVERKLAYSAALYISSINNPYGLSISDHINIWDRDYYLDKLPNPSFFKRQKITEKLTKDFLIMAEHRYYLALFEFELYLLMDSFSEKKLRCREVTLRNEQLKLYLKGFTLTTMTKLHTLLKQNNFGEFKDYVEMQLSFLTILSHYIFVMLDINIFRSSQDSPNSIYDNSVQSKRPANIDRIMQGISTLFEYVRVVGLKPYFNSIIFTFLGSLQFLKENIQLDPRAHGLLVEGINQLNFLRSSPYYRPQVDCTKLIIN